jgi:hypothetical protein
MFRTMISGSFFEPAKGKIIVYHYVAIAYKKPIHQDYNRARSVVPFEREGKCRVPKSPLRIGSSTVESVSYPKQTDTGERANTT